MDSKLFFIAGITGRVGGAAAKLLLAQGHKLRALARDPQKASAWAEQGVDVRQGDFNDPAALASALTGVDGAYLMMAPIMAPGAGYPEATAITASLQQALTQAPPPRIVVLSSFGSEQPSGLGLITGTYILEQGLKSIDIPTAIIRAGGFYDNNVPALASIRQTGIFYSFTQPTDRPTFAIGTPDIGAEVVKLLTAPAWSGTRVIELGTPVSPDEIAAGMAEALGRPVQAQAVPRQAWSGVLESFGLPKGSTGPYEEMMDSINSGWIHAGVPGTEPVPATLTPAQFYSQAEK